jgi:hypothetical protein
MTELGQAQKIKDMQKTIQGLKHEMERLQAVNEIQNLMSKYEYLHMTNRHLEVVELYAKKTPGVKICLKDLGFWEGPNAARRAWSLLQRMNEKSPVGHMGIHPTTTSVIEVSKDSRTAKAVWLGTGIVARKNMETGAPEALFEWDRYGVDFVKEDGKWKFWHFHLYGLFKSNLDESWAQQFVKGQEMPPIPEDLKPDGPAVDEYPYHPDTPSQLIPLPPEPFDTFGGTFSY